MLNYYEHGIVPNDSGNDVKFGTYNLKFERFIRFIRHFGSVSTSDNKTVKF